MDLLAQAALQLTTVSAAVWGAAQTAKTFFPEVRNIQLFTALLCGPLFAVGAAAVGWFPLVAQVSPDHPIWAAAFAGLITTLGAKLFNDLLYNPLRDALAGRR